MLSFAYVGAELLSLPCSHGSEHHSEDSDEDLIRLIRGRPFLLEQTTEIVKSCEYSILDELRKAKNKANDMTLSNCYSLGFI